MHCKPVLGHWAVELLQRTAKLPRSIGQWSSCNAVPNCLWGVGSGTPAVHYHIGCPHWAVEVL